MSHLAFYFAPAHCRLLVLYCAPSVLAWWLHIKDMQSNSHSLHQRAHAYYVRRLFVHVCVSLDICYSVGNGVDE